MLIIGIILVICAVVFATIPFFINDLPDVLVYFFFTTAIPMLIFGMYVITSKNPTKNDVLKGKAIYQETIHITGNDTIKTYKIVWKNKYDYN